MDDIARLQAEIADLRDAVARLSSLPEMQAQVRAKLEEKQAHLEQIQYSGLNLGAGNTIGRIRDIIGGDQITQTINQFVLGGGDPAELRALLERLREAATQQPGAGFDLYQAVAVGLGRAQLVVGVDAKGRLRVTSQPGAGAPAVSLVLFEELLVALRAAILPPNGTLPDEEREARAARYRDLIIEQFKCLKLEGLYTSTQAIILPLEEVYVQLRAVAEAPEAADAFTPEERRLLRLLEEERAPDEALREARLRLDAARRERWTRDRLERFPIADALRDPLKRGLVILGDPGSGKSTLLQFLALVFARGPKAAAERLGLHPAEADRLPIFAPLAAYDDMLRRSETSELTVQEFLPRYYDRRHGAPGLGPVFDHAIEQGHALILLDGLDEVIEESKRRFVVAQVTRFVQAVLPRGNRVVLTSRIYGYREARLGTDLPHITVLDFRQEEIAIFARQWFQAFQRWRAGGQLIPQAELDAQQEERRLLEEIRTNPGVERLAVNPLLLTMLALLRQQIGTLPERRITLYDEYVRALILRWEENRSRGARSHGQPVRIDPKEAEDALMTLALWLQQSRPSGTATGDDLLGQLTSFYLWEGEGLGPDDKITPPQRRRALDRAKAFLHDMRQYAGMLIERGQNAFGFRHLTFQEYFAGRALARMDHHERWAVLAPNLHSGRWREPLLLCAARLGVSENRGDEASGLVARMLDAESEYEELLHRDLFLAADCASDDLGLRVPLLQRIADTLWPLVDSHIPAVKEGAMRRLARLALLRAGEGARLSGLAGRVREALWKQIQQGRDISSSLNYHKALIAQNILQHMALVDPETRADIQAHLAVDESDIQQAAVSMLSPLALTDPSVRQALLVYLTSDHASEQDSAADALAPLVLVDSSVRQIFLENLTRQDDSTWVAAVDAFTPLISTDPTLYKAIFDKLNNESFPVEQLDQATLATLAQTDTILRQTLANRLTLFSIFSQNKIIQALIPFAATDKNIRQTLINCLNSEKLHTHQGILQNLSYFAKDPDFYVAIQKCLYDTHFWIRSEAVRILGPFAAEDLVLRNTIKQLLNDSEQAVRDASVRALAPIAGADPKIWADLKQLAEHRDWRTRQSVLPVLGFLPDDLREQTWTNVLTLEICHESSNAQARLITIIARFAETDHRIYSLLYGQLTNGGAIARREAVRALAPLAATDQALRQALRERLVDTDSMARQEAVRALSPFIDSDHTLREDLLGRIFDTNWNVWTATVQGLAPLAAAADPALCQALVKQLGADNRHVRRTVTQAFLPLVAIAAERSTLSESRLMVLQELSDCLADRSENVWSSVRGTLSTLAATAPDVRQALQERLTDEDEGTRTAALLALSPFVTTDTTLQQEIQHFLSKEKKYWVWKTALEVLSQCIDSDPETAQIFRRYLNNTKPGVRKNMLEVLAPLMTTNSTLRNAVYQRLADENGDVRLAAVRALTPLVSGDPALRDILTNCLYDDSWSVRIAAIKALSPLASTDTAVHQVLQDLANEKVGVQRKAVEILSPLITTESVLSSTFVSFLSSSDPNFRASVARALAPRAAIDPATRQALHACLSDSSSSVREAAIQALAPLASIEPALQQALQDRLNNDSPRVREAAANALMPLVAATPDLQLAFRGCLADSNLAVRLVAMRTLAPLATSNPAILQALVERLSDDSWEVQREAVHTLALLDPTNPNLQHFLQDCLDNNTWIKHKIAIEVVSPLAVSTPMLRASLLNSLADANLHVRKAALFALAPLISSDATVEGRLLPVIGNVSDLVYLSDMQPDGIRRALAVEYGALVRDDPARRAKIVALLDDVDWRMRLAAVEILEAAGEAAVREALPQLLAALEDERGLDSWPARLAAAALLLNDDRRGEQALQLTLEALRYGADAILPIPGAAEVRRQAALTLGKLKALYHRREVATVIVGLLASESDPQVLDGLYEALGALAGEPENQ